MTHGVLDDLTRRRFGRLLVIWRAPNYVSPKGLVATLYLCRCDCGTVLDVRADTLKIGETRSCGCLRADLSRERREFYGRFKRWTPDASQVLADLAAREREWQEWLTDDGRVEAASTGGARVLPLRAPAVPRQAADVTDRFRRDCGVVRDGEADADRAVGG